MLKRFGNCVRVMIPVLLLLLAPLAMAEPTLDDALSELRNYEFGNSRLSQTVIDAAVRAARGNDQSGAELAAKLSSALLEAKSADAKRYACRALGELGHAGGVSALAQQLANGEMHDLAAWALRQIQDESATSALLDAVGTLKGRQRLDVIQSLGHKQGDAVVKALGDIAASTGSTEEAAAAFDALAMVPGLDSANIFVTLAGRVSEDRLGAFLAAKLEKAQGLHREGQENVAKRLYQEVYQEGAAPSHATASALHGLVITDPGNATALLLKEVTSDDVVISAAAAQCIRLLVDPGVLAAFSEIMPELSVSAQQQVLRALTDRGEKVGGLALGIAQSTEDPELKGAAVYSLGKAGGADALDFLIALAASEGNSDLGRAARTSLASLPADINGTLVSRLGGADEDAAELILRTLEERKAEEVSGDLLALAGNEDASHRGAILKSLEALATPGQFEEVLALLEKSGEASDRRALEKVLIAVGQKRGEPSEPLVDALDSGKEEMKVSACRIIAGIGPMTADEAYRDALEAQLDADNGDLRSTAIRALGDWPNREPLPALLKQADKAKKGSARDEFYGAILNLISRSQVLVAPPEGSSFELTHLERVSEAPAPMGPSEALPILQGILGSTADDGLQKKALSALGSIALPEALTLAVEHAKRPALRLEAHTSMLSIAKYLMGADRTAAVAALQEIVNTSDNELHKNQAQAILNQAPALGDYLMAWRVSGPYAVEDMREQVHFQDILPTTLPAERPFVMELLETLGGFVRRAYVVTGIQAEAATDAVLELGSDDGITVWLNGEKVHEYPEGRELIPGDDKVPVSLKKGENLLKIVVHQKASYWHFCARLTDTSGKPLPGVTSNLPKSGNY